MSYYQKYLYYKKKYVELKMKGGKLCSAENNKPLIEGDIDSFLEYIRSEYDCTNKYKTTRKYFVILYGPPGSGKTDAFKESCKLIKEHFEEHLNIDEIMSTFINSGLDDLVYRFVHKTDEPHNIDNTKIKLIKSLNEFLRRKLGYSSGDEKITETFVKNPINASELGNNSYKIYSKMKSSMDDMSSLLLWVASYFKRNILFEISSGDFKYINNMIALLSGYIPIIIYPYSNNLKQLFERNAIRSLSEGRFVSCGFIRDKMTLSIQNFNIMLENFDREYSGDIIVCSYDNTKRQKTDIISYNNLRVKKNNTNSISIYTVLPLIDATTELLPCEK